jgi:hypothetical protein
VESRKDVTNQVTTDRYFGKTPLCHGCNYPVKRGAVPIIWPGTAHTAVYCSLKCAESKGVQMHPIQKALQEAAEKQNH